MDENVKADDQQLDILLVLDKEKKTLKAVKGIDKEGNLETVPANEKNSAAFMKYDKHSNILQNFFTNFMRQVKDPTRFEFFNIPRNLIDNVGKLFNEMAKSPQLGVDAATDLMKDFKINPEDHLNKEQVQEQAKETPAEQKTEEQIAPKEDVPNNNRYDETKINWEQLADFGITKEMLDKSGALQPMLKGFKSNDAFPVEMNLGSVILKADARLSLRHDKDGNVVLAIHGIRQQPELEKSFFGHHFTEQDKNNLLNTGNMGRLAETKDYRTGETSLCYISLDKVTNELVSMKAQYVKIPDEVKGVQLNDEQKQQLREGKAIHLDGMNAKSGKTFSSYVQINADKRSIEFLFDNAPKQQQEKSQQQEQKSEQWVNGVRIPTKLGGVQLSDIVRNELKEGRTVYISGMKDRQGQEYSAYVKINFDEKKPKFYKWDPDRSITPANENREQVMANNDGVRSNQTMHIKDILKPGQTAPDEKQKEKIEQKQEDEQPKIVRKMKI